MRTTLKACALAALALLALLPAAARATEWWVEVEPEGANSWTSLGSVTFTAGAFTVSCSVTFSGELELGFVAEASAGEIADTGRFSAARWSGCTGGEINTVLALPWAVHFTEMTGTLPEAVTAEQDTIEGLAVQLTTGGFLTCLYRGNVPTSTSFSGSSPYETGLTSLSTNSLTLVSGAACPTTARVSGTLSAATKPRKRPTALKFPFQEYLFPGAGDATFTFTNTIGGVITVNEVELSGTPSRYSIRSETCRRNPPVQLMLNQSCQVTVNWGGTTRKRTFLRLIEGAVNIGVVKMT